MADDSFDYSGNQGNTSRTDSGVYINDPVRGNQGRDDPMFQAAQARQRSFTSGGDKPDFINIDLQLKNLQKLQQATNKYWNDQKTLREKSYNIKQNEANLSTKQVADELASLDKKIKLSNKAYTDELKNANSLHEANLKWMSSEQKKQYDFVMKDMRNAYQSNANYIRDAYGDAWDKVTKSANDQMDKLTASTSDKMKKSLLGSLDDFSRKLTGLNATTQINRIASGVANGGTVSSAQSSVNNQYSLQRSAGLSDADVKNMSSSVSKAVSASGNSISRADLYGAMNNVAQTTGIKNRKDLVDLGQSQLASNKLAPGAAQGIESYISSMYNSTKNEGLAAQSGTDMYNMVSYVLSGRNKNLKRTTASNLNSIMTSVNDITPGLASYASPKDTAKISKNYASALVASQSTMGDTKMMDIIAKSAEGTWSDAQLNRIGITKGQAQSAMKSGNFTSLLDKIKSAAQSGGASTETLQSMGLSATDVGRMKGYNSEEFNQDQSAVNSRKGATGTAKDDLRKNSINETNIFSQAGNAISNSFIGRGWESIQRSTGLGGKDLLGKVTEINTWVRMIATKETFDSIKGIKNWFSGTKLGGNLKNIFKGSKDAAGLADDAIDSAGKSEGIMSKFSNILSKAKGLFSVPSDVAKAGGITGKVSRFLGIGSKATSGLGLLSMGLDGLGGITNSSSWLGSKKGKSISGSISSMLGAMIGGTGDGWTGKSSFLDKAFDTIGNIGKGAAVGGMTGSAFAGIGAIPGAIVGAITSGVTSIFGGKNIAKFFKGTWDKLKGGVSKSFDWIGNGISSAWDWVTGKDTKSKKSSKSDSEGNNSNKKGYSKNYDYNSITKDYINGKVTKKEFQKLLEKSGQSHKNGLDAVPYDGYIAELHKDEKVLTADQAKDYNKNADPFNQSAATKAGQTQFNQMSVNSTSGGSAIDALTTMFKNANFSEDSFKTKHKSSSSSSDSSDTNTQSEGTAYNGKVPTSTVKGISQLAPYAMKYASLYKTVPSIIIAQAGAESGFGNAVPSKDGWNWWGLTGNAAKHGVTTINGYPYTNFENLDQATKYYTSAVTRMDPGKSHWNIKSNLYGIKTFKDAANIMANDTSYHEASPASYLRNLNSSYKTYDLGKYDKAAGYKVGTPWVPDDQIALLHKGEAVIPAKNNPYGSDGNAKSATSSLMKIDDSGIVSAIQWAVYKLLENQSGSDDSWKSTPVKTKQRSALRI